VAAFLSEILVWAGLGWRALVNRDIKINVVVVCAIFMFIGGILLGIF